MHVFFGMQCIKMLNIFQNIPNVHTLPLTHVFENMKLQHKPNTLWSEFGVASGRTNISKFTNDKVCGFDKGTFNRDDVLRPVNSNAELIKGWFDATLLNFMHKHDRFRLIQLNCIIHIQSLFFQIFLYQHTLF
jgi:hypothetical protein